MSRYDYGFKCNDIMAMSHNKTQHFPTFHRCFVCLKVKFMAGSWTYNYRRSETGQIWQLGTEGYEHKIVRT